MVSIEQAVLDKYPTFFDDYPGFVARPFLAFLRWLFRERQVNAFLAKHAGIEGIEFVEKVLEHFDFSYAVTNTERENIPAAGRVVIVANHPLGGLDALALIKLVGEVRPDVKVVANDMLAQLPPMRPLLLPIDSIRNQPSKESIRRIHRALSDEQAVIVFPSGEVSRVRATGIQDLIWHNGFLHFARKAEAPILPVFMHGTNSPLFYGVSMIARPAAGLLLMQEMYRQKGRSIGIRVGEIIPLHHIDSRSLSDKAKVNLVKSHLYRVGHRKRGLISTEKAIAHPENRRVLKKELAQADLIGTTPDGKRIYLCDYQPGGAVMREIGRLRELTFRRVGEGTGQRRDLDRYDQHYKHVVLWDDDDLEIVGSYRIGDGRQIIPDHGMAGFYTHSLFPFGEDFERYMGQGIEAGRSFVQPRYWGSRALDYLLLGVGAYLYRNPELRYIVGAVTISNTMPKGAKDLLVYFYSTYFGDDSGLVTASQRYVLGQQERDELKHVFRGNSYKEDFVTLKECLGQFGVTVPTLFKQYTELCEPGGCRFLDFSVDPAFNYCVDGLIVIDVHQMKRHKWERYIGSHAQPQAA